MRRFRTLTVGLAILISAPPAAGQLSSGLELGAKVGVTFSTLSVEDDEGADIGTRTAFGGGAFLRIPVGRVAVQPELLYLQKGAEVSGEDFDDGSVTLKLDYLEIPLLLVVPIHTAGGVSPYLFGGPSIAFETGCSVALDTPGFDAEVDCEEGEDVDIEFERTKTDIGAVLGAGLRIPAGPGALLLEGRYTFGLRDLNDSDEDNALRNRSGALMVGFSLPIGR